MTIRFAAPLLAAVAMPISPAAAQLLEGSAAMCNGSSPSVRVNITGLKDRSGRLKLELYPATEDDLLKDDTKLKNEGKFFARLWTQTPQAGAVSLCIRAPSPGRYALLFTHDRDGKNKFNFWKDGAGFASNRKLGRSRPQLKEAVINVGAGVTTIAIHAQYLRGLSGFAPYDPND